MLADRGAHVADAATEDALRGDGDLFAPLAAVVGASVRVPGIVESTEKEHEEEEEEVSILSISDPVADEAGLFDVAHNLRCRVDVSLISEEVALTEGSSFLFFGEITEVSLGTDSTGPRRVTIRAKFVKPFGATTTARVYYQSVRYMRLVERGYVLCPTNDQTSASL
jgi:hypothetical protein